MSTLDVWNAALSAAHARGRVSSLTEASPEREVCSEWYSIVLRGVQSAARWPACKALERLALLTESDDSWADSEPEPGYQYAYALPTSFLHPWYLTDFSRFSLSFSPVLSRQIISTNTPGAVLAYARLLEDTTQWSPTQTTATIYALAAYITGPLTGKNSLIQANIQLATQQLEGGQASSANSLEPDPRPAVPWLAARGYSSAPGVRFFYPLGSLFPAGAVNAN